MALRLAVLTAVAPLLVSSSAAAAPPKSPFSLTISPARVVVPADVDAHEERVRVSNTGTVELHVDVLVKEFELDGEGGIRFPPEGPASAAAWLDVRPRSLDLRPGESRSVRVRVRVPERPEPGERQVAVVFRAPPQETGRGFAVSGAVATQFLVAVPGPVVRRIALGPLHAPRFADSGPIDLRLRVENLGTVHRDFVAPHGLVATAGGRPAAFPSFTLLRGSARVVRAELRDLPAVCWCRIRVTADDGNGRPLMAEARVLVFPLRLAIGVLLVALGLTALLRLLRERHRRRVSAEIAIERERAYWQGREEARRLLRRRGSS
jgi:hypothetical protein